MNIFMILLIIFLIIWSFTGVIIFVSWDLDTMNKKQIGVMGFLCGPMVWILGSVVYFGIYLEKLLFYIQNKLADK